MIRLGRWLVAGCLVALLGVPGVALAQQDALDRIDALQTLSDQDNAKALKELQAQAQKMAYLATASSTSINSVGNALEVLAKKQ